MRSLLLLFCLFVHVACGGKRATSGYGAIQPLETVSEGFSETPNLRKLTSELALISRITTGIAIRDGLQNSSLKADELAADFLKIRTPEAIGNWSRLKPEDTRNSLDKLQKRLEGLEETNFEDPGGLEQSLGALSRIYNLTESMADIENTSYSDNFIAKFAAVGSVDLTSLMDDTVKEMLDALKIILEGEEPKSDPKGPEEEQTLMNAKQALLTYRNKRKGYEKYVEKIKNYEGVIKPLTDFITHDSERGARVLTMPFIVEPASIYWNSGLHRMHTNLKEFAREIGRIGAVEVSELESVLNELRVIFSKVEMLREPAPETFYSCGLSQGSKDLAQLAVVQGEAEQWLKDKVTEGRDPKKVLEETFAHLGSFTEKLGSLESSHRTVLNISRDDFSAFHRLFHFLSASIAVQASWSRNSSTEVMHANASDCFKDFKYEASRDVDKKQDELKKLRNFSTQLADKTERLRSNLKDVLGEASLENYDGLSAIDQAITDDVRKASHRMTKDQAWAVTARIRALAGVHDMYTGLRTINEKLESSDMDGLDELIRRIKNEELKTDVVKEVQQEILKPTSLLPAFRCLRAINFSEADKDVLIWKYGVFLRSIRSDDIVKIKEILEKVDQVRTDFEDFETATKVNATATPAKLDNSLEVATNLGRGVERLEQLVQVIEHRESLEKVLNLSEPLNEAIAHIRMPPIESVWTLTTRHRVDLLLQNVTTNVEQQAAHFRTRQLSDMFAFMDNITRLEGVVHANPTLFANPIAKSLMASNEADAQLIVPLFEEISHLTLDFAAFKTQFQKAAHVAQPLRHFYDALFGINRTAMAEEKRRAEQKPRAEKPDARAEQLVAEPVAAESAEEQNNTILYIGAIVVLVILVAVVVVVAIVCCKRKKLNERLRRPETWRHLRFLPEGKLKKYEDSEYTPLHLAVMHNKIEDVRKHLKNGAFVNVHSLGKTVETPLHTAVQNDSTEIVQVLLKNGADVHAMDADFETPIDQAKGDARLLKMLKAYEQKAANKRLPQTLPLDKYKVYVDKSVRKGLKEFCKSYKKNIVDTVEDATHVVVKTDSDGTFDLEKDDAMTYFSSIFSARILMSADWLVAAGKRRNDFRDDFKFRVKRIRFKGKEHATIDEIQADFQQMRVPYLTGTTIHFNQGQWATVEWGEMRETAVRMGATKVDDFPVAEGMLPGQAYWRDDIGHVFVVYMRDNAGELEAQYPYLRTQKCYTFLERDEFVTLLLSHKISQKQLDEGNVSRPSRPSRSKGSKGSRGSKGSTESKGSKEAKQSKESNGSKEAKRSKGSKSKESKSKSKESKESATPSAEKQ
ncbi:unnamed protein product [Caenorhabditis sp. 36 PRJEB53466]|nr:unnamed protein product [Caenorhabditis sp. 36 PRJEB53466]